MRKPKGWYHRYEIVRGPVQFRPNEPTKDRWHAVHYFGRGKGAGSRMFDSDPGPDATDETLIRMAGADTVTVPVYVIRNGVIGEPYFGKYYGQK